MVWLSEALFAMSTIVKVSHKPLTVVDLHIAHGVARRHCVPHLRRVVVAAHQQILALHLLAVVAEPIAARSQFRVLLLKIAALGDD